MATPNDVLRAVAVKAENWRFEAQLANEALYAAEYDASGGPRFDRDQPFGEPASTPADPQDLAVLHRIRQQLAAADRSH